MSKFKQARAMLIAGKTYSEIHSLTDISPQIISKAAASAEQNGHKVTRKTPEERKAYMRNQMPCGTVGKCLDALSVEEMEWLMSKSTASWQAAIVRVIRESFNDSSDCG